MVIAEHEQVLAGRPPDRRDTLAATTAELSSARSRLAYTEAAAARSAADLDGMGPLAGLSRHGRDQRRLLEDRLHENRSRAGVARDRCEEIASRVERLQREQNTYRRFEADEGWRRDDPVRLHHQLDHHWAHVVAACVAADDPLAYGIAKLRHARTTWDGDRQAVDAQIPPDRAEERQQARRRLADAVQQRHQAEEQLAAWQDRLQDAGRRRWGRHDHESVADAQAQVAVAKSRVQQAAAGEGQLRERLAALAEHQQRRHEYIADNSARRKELDPTVAHIDSALDRTRSDRVAAPANEGPEHLEVRIGPAPESPAGRAVWCHLASSRTPPRRYTAHPSPTATPLDRSNAGRATPTGPEL